MLISLFVLGGFWFWLLVLGLLVLIELSTMSENHFGFGWIALFCGVLWLFSDFNPLTWIWHNPWTLLIDSGVYLAIGLIWGIAKWFFHLKNVNDSITPSLDRYREMYETAKARADNPFVGSLQAYLEDRSIIPVAKNNKNQISVWMLWWPFSLAYTLFADVVRRLCHWIMDHYIVVFDRINNSVFGNLK